MKALDDTQTRGDAALARPIRTTASALFAMCIAQGVTTDYMAFVEKHQFPASRPAKRFQQLRAAPAQARSVKFYDAYLTAGLSEYMVGSLPFFVRWFVHFDNVNGQQGEGHGESGDWWLATATTSSPSPRSCSASSTCARRRPQEAQQLLVELAHDYPENPLFRKELTKLNNKLGVFTN